MVIQNSKPIIPEWKSNDYFSINSKYSRMVGMGKSIAPMETLLDCLGSILLQVQVVKTHKRLPNVEEYENRVLCAVFSVVLVNECDAEGIGSR